MIEVTFGIEKQGLRRVYQLLQQRIVKVIDKQSEFQIFVQYITAETIQNYGKSGTAAREDQRVSAMKFVLHSRLKIALSVNNLTFNQTV